MSGGKNMRIGNILGNTATALAMVVCVTTAVMADPDFVALPGTDKACIFVKEMPAGTGGFLVERAGEGGTAFTTITTAPVTNALTTKGAETLLGKDNLPAFLSAMKVKSVEEFAKLYKESPANYNMFAIFSAQMAQLLGKFYCDEGLTPGGTYQYRVIFTAANGKEISKLGPKSVRIVPPALTKPTGFKLDVKDSATTAIWDKPGEGFSGIGWNVYRSESETGPFAPINKSIIAIIGDTYYNDRMLENGKTYYYYVASVDMVGNQSEKTEVLVAKPKDMTPPAPPGNFTSTLSKDKKAQLTWEMGLEPDVAGYTIYRGFKARGDDMAKLTGPLISPDTVVYTDETVEEGMAYFYRLTATDTSGNESTGSVIVSLQPPDFTPPAAPTALKIAKRDRAVALSWNPNTEKDLNGYNIYRGSTPEAINRINSSPVDPGMLEYLDAGMVSGEKYYYAISAIDQTMNESPLTPIIEFIAPDFIPPEFPASLGAIPGDTIVNLTWPANLENDLAGYRIYRAAGKEGPFDRVGGDFTPDILTYSDTAVENGKIYWYYATAFDKAENESASSTLVSAKPRDPVPPAPPTGISTEGGEEAITITWAANTEIDIMGYKVMRSGLKNGVYEELNAEAIVPKTATEYADRAVQPDVEYFYRVVAIDTSDNESKRSEPAGPGKLKPKETAPAQTAPQGK